MTADIKALLKKLGLIDQEINTISKTTEGLSQQCFIVKLVRVIELQQPRLKLPKLFVIKVFNCQQSYNNELIALNALSHKGFTPCLIHAGEFHETQFILMEYLQGISLASSPMNSAEKLIKSLALMANFHHSFTLLRNESPLELVKSIEFQSLLQSLMRDAKLEGPFKHQVQEAVDRVLTQLTELVIQANSLVICHGDFNFSNILLNEHADFILDFECLSRMPREYDIAMMLAVNELPFSDVNNARSIYHNAFSVLSNETTSLCNHKINIYYQASALINALWYFARYHETGSIIFKGKSDLQFNLLNDITR